MVASLCGQLQLKPHSTNTEIIMAGGFEVNILKEDENVLMTVEGMPDILTFLVVNEDMSSRLIIGRPPMKAIGASLHFDKVTSTFRSGDQVETVSL